MSVKYPLMKNGMYYGRMNDYTANLVMDIRSKKVIPGLTNMIFDFPPELVLKSLEEGRSIREIIKEQNIDYTKYVGGLRDYQTVGTAFMYVSKRSIIGDGVGVGKTAEIAALINYIHMKKEMKRFIIAVETSALGQTQCELMRFTGLHIVQLPSDAVNMKRVIKKTDWSAVNGVVIKHSALKSDLLSKWLSLYLDENGKSRIFDTFFLDESSVIKNVTTKTYRYTLNICNIVNRVHFMNATTFETNIMDIYNQVDMLDDTLMPKKWRIENEFCTFGRKKYWTSAIVENKRQAQLKFSRVLSGYKNQAKFKGALKLFYFGRSSAEVGLERPNVYKVYEVEPTTEQSLAMAKGYRYMEVLNSPSNIQDICIPFDRQNVPKLNRLIELVENEFSNEKVMVYCFHLEAQRVIAEELTQIGRNPVILNGEDDDESRWAKVENFNKGKYDVIITNIKKSLNLYGGDVCIFYTLETNPAKMEQIRGRIDRNVDDKLKTFVLLVYKGTDEYRFLTQVVRQRAKDAKELTIDAKTAIDFFMEAMEREVTT